MTKASLSEAPEASQLERVEMPSTTDMDASDVKGDLELFDAKFKRRVTRKIDMRLVPLCAFVYLVNYLDRSNIGNGKILNQETGDSLLQRTGMTSVGYSITLTIFGIAYSVFDIPANFIMKRYVRPSYWLGFLMFSWGVLTLGFAFVQNYASVVVLRFFVGVFEAGFFPGKSTFPNLPSHLLLTDLFCTRHCISYHILVYARAAISTDCLCPCFCIAGWRLWRMHWVWRGLHEWRRWSPGIPLAIPHRGTHHYYLCSFGPCFLTRLAICRSVAQH